MMKSVASWNNLAINPFWYFVVTFKSMRRLWKNTTRIRFAMKYSLISMRQFHIFFNWAKNWHQIVCWFSWIFLNSPVFAWYVHKIVLKIKTKQFDEHIMQKLGNSGKFSKINKQSDVKFWLKWREHGAVSYLLSCTKFHCAMIELD